MVDKTNIVRSSTTSFLMPLWCWKGILLVMLTATPLAGLAVMPPYAEAKAALKRIEISAQQRAEAPIVLRLKVSSSANRKLQRNQCPDTEIWSAKAKIIDVIRGEMDRNDAIKIEYQRDIFRCPSPVHEELPMLNKGDIIEAYLTCNKHHCQPVAGPMSFMPENEFQTELNHRQQEERRHEVVVNETTPVENSR